MLSSVSPGALRHSQRDECPEVILWNVFVMLLHKWGPVWPDHSHTGGWWWSTAFNAALQLGPAPVLLVIYRSRCVLAVPSVTMVGCLVYIKSNGKTFSSYLTRVISRKPIRSWKAKILWEEYWWCCEPQVQNCGVVSIVIRYKSPKRQFSSSFWILDFY